MYVNRENDWRDPNEKVSTVLLHKKAATIHMNLDKKAVRSLELDLQGLRAS
jgi:hypothetical protein